MSEATQPQPDEEATTASAPETAAAPVPEPAEPAQAPGRTSRVARDEHSVLERIEAFRRRRPKLNDEVVTLAHGAGGKSSAALIDAVFLEAFRNETLAPLADGAVITLPSGDRLAFSTDSFVVSPLRFPGGSIGELAVNGTVNDVSMMGARPAWLSSAFVIEEGFSIAELRAVVADMAAAAAAAGVTIVTGDTKVVGRKAADGLYINTAGVGLIPPERHLDAALVQAGDSILVSGTIADHGVAVMLARGDLNLEADVSSDTAPLNGLVDVLFDAAPDVRWLRDPTRGGVATVCNELAQATGLSMILDEVLLPIEPPVLGACDMLGIDPLYVANEGKLLAIVPPDQEEAALKAMRDHPLGARAAKIGTVRADPPGIVVLLTTFGGTRIVDMLVGDPLPRIC
ncbi:MAG: hydrogenase expression/formation protein HypE [Acidimicrobiales bacterium]